MQTASPLSSEAATISGRACVRCHRLKTRCRPGRAGILPCQRCEENDHLCEMPKPKPPRPPYRLKDHEKKINELRTDLQVLEGRLAVLEAAPGTLARTQLVGTTPSLSPRSDVAPPRKCSQYMPDVNLDELNKVINLHDPASSDLIRTNLSLSQFGASPPHKRQKYKALDTPDEPPERLQKTAFEVFSRRCFRSINCLDIESPLHTPQSVRSRSEMLYWAIVAVGSREAPDLAEVYKYGAASAVEHVKNTLVGELPSLEDFKGCLIVSLWLSSVRPPGHLVAMAYELNLHRSGYGFSPLEADIIRIDRFRLWCQVVLLDLLYSLASGKPRLISDDEIKINAQRLLSIPSPRFQDYRTVAQLELCLYVSRMQSELQHLEETLASDSMKITRLMKVHEAVLDRWYSKWQIWGESLPDEDGVFSGMASIKTQYFLGKFQLCYPLLRGINSASEVTSGRKVAVFKAVEAAIGKLDTAVKDFQPPIIAFVSEVTNVNFACAASFLIKITHLLPGEFDSQGIRVLIESTIDLLKSVPGGFYARILRQMLIQAESHETPVENEDLGFSDFLRSIIGTEQPFDFDFEVYNV